MIWRGTPPGPLARWLGAGSYGPGSQMARSSGPRMLRMPRSTDVEGLIHDSAAPHEGTCRRPWGTIRNGDGVPAVRRACPEPSKRGGPRQSVARPVRAGWDGVVESEDCCARAGRSVYPDNLQSRTFHAQGVQGLRHARQRARPRCGPHHRRGVRHRRQVSGRRRDHATDRARAG